MTTPNFYKKALSTAILATACSAANTVYAAALEEILVTATKRSANVQDIPMSVAAVSGDKMEAMAITDFEGLAATIPNFHVGDGIVSTNVNMRGMGSGGDRAFEQSVGMFIDGVYMPRSRQYRSPFFDAERVEVLRGPQAVLFGLNSTAGAVAVHSAKSRPGDDFFAELKAAYETEYEGVTTSVVVGGGITDTLALRLAIEDKESDGYFKNTWTGDEEGDTDATLARLTAVWEPSSQLTITAKYEVADFDQNGHHGELFAGSGGLILDDNKLDYVRTADGQMMSFIDAKPGLFQETENAMVIIDYEMGEHNLTTTLGYSDMEYDFALDVDASPVSFQDAAIREEYEHSSIEIRLTSPTGNTFEYVTGVYAHNGKLFNNNFAATNLTTLDAFGSFAPPALGGALNGAFLPGGALFGLTTPVGVVERSDNFFNQEQDVISAFFSGTYNLADDLRVIAGVRYVKDEKDTSRSAPVAEMIDANGNKLGDIGTVAFGGALGPFGITTPTALGEYDVSNENVMPEVVVQWDMESDVMFYAKYGESAKGGGVGSGGNIVPSTVVFEDETVQTFELGMKSNLLDGAAEFNATLFRSEFKDLQVNSFVPGSDGRPKAAIQNAAGAVTQGVELDGRWLIADWLTFSGSLAYLDGEYDDFPIAACNTSETADPVTGGCNRDGYDLPYAAEVSGTVGFDFNYALSSNLELLANVTASYSDDYFTDGTLEPRAIQDSYTLLNASIGVEGDEGRWGVSVIGKNLTDEEVNNVSQPVLGLIGYLAPPTTITVQGFYRFGG